MRVADTIGIGGPDLREVDERGGLHRDHIAGEKGVAGPINENAQACGSRTLGVEWDYLSPITSQTAR